MTTEPLFSSDRLFKVWRYTVSHSQLLIVSHKDVGKSGRPGKSATRIEVLFRDVYFMAVSDAMSGLAISKCDASEVPAELKVPVVPTDWYRLTSRDSAGFVNAGNFITSEDELDFMDPSALLKPPYL